MPKLCFEELSDSNFDQFAHLGFILELRYCLMKNINDTNGKHSTPQVQKKRDKTSVCYIMCDMHMHIYVYMHMHMYVMCYDLPVLYSGTPSLCWSGRRGSKNGVAE